MTFDINILTDLINNVGFPIVVCGYVMVKLNKTVEKNTEATNNLVLLVNKLFEHLHDDDEEKGDKE